MSTGQVLDPALMLRVPRVPRTAPSSLPLLAGPSLTRWGAQISPASGKHNRVPCHTTVSSESGNAVLSASRELIQRAPARCAPCLTLDYKISSFIFSAGSRHGAGTGSQEGQEGHRGLFCENTHSLSLQPSRVSGAAGRASVTSFRPGPAGACAACGYLHSLARIFTKLVLALVTGGETLYGPPL